MRNNESVIVEKMLQIMPYEIVVQYSSQTDNINVLKENAQKEAHEENKGVLEVLLTYALETLETYDSELLGHINYEMKEESPDTWKQERKEIKAYINELKKQIHHCETYTKAEIIKMFMQDEFELNLHIQEEAKEMGITAKAFAKQIAETQFDIGLEEKSIIRVGRRYKLA